MLPLSSALLLPFFPLALAGTESLLASSPSCTVKNFTQVPAAVANCTSITVFNMSVPAGSTLDFSSVRNGTTITFQGTTTFGYQEWTGPLVQFKGGDVHVKGAAGSKLDGQGPLYWDGLGGNGGKKKPKFVYAHDMTDSTIDGLYIVNSPVQVFSISGATGIKLSNVVVNDSAGDVNKLGHNTDAFDVSSSTDVTISGATVHNQDDCLAINSVSGLVFEGGYCSGGHGLSIGSVGGRSDNTVENVVIKDSKVVNSLNGVRIKTNYNTTGLITNVTYSGISLSGISGYGLDVQQDYLNGGPTGTPTSGVLITDLTLSNVVGTVQESALDYYILCGNGSCSDWHFQDVRISGSSNSSSCNYVPSGFHC